jgi:hypothetical protein
MRWNLAFSVAACAIGALVAPSWRVAGGLFAGGALSCANFWVLQSLIARVARARNKGLLLTAAFTKMIALMVVVWLILRFTHVHIIAFTIGLSTFLVAILLATLRTGLADATPTPSN